MQNAIHRKFYTSIYSVGKIDQAWLIDMSSVIV